MITTMHHLGRWLAAILLVAAGLLLAPAASADNGALGTLALLSVHDKAPMTGYSRDRFGPAWTDDNDDDLGRNHCDTRDDILGRDLVGPVRDGRCEVVSGTLNDPYTGAVILFRRGPQTSSRVQIDHIVSLGDAWATGAQRLTPRQRVNLANDPRNLRAVDGAANDNKGESDAAQWLPPNTAFHCAYVTDQVIVKAAYHLWITAAERDAMARVLVGCR